MRWTIETDQCSDDPIVYERHPCVHIECGYDGRLSIWLPKWDGMVILIWGGPEFVINLQWKTDVNAEYVLVRVYNVIPRVLTLHRESKMAGHTLPQRDDLIQLST